MTMIGRAGAGGRLSRCWAAVAAVVCVVMVNQHGRALGNATIDLAATERGLRDLVHRSGGVVHAGIALARIGPAGQRGVRAGSSISVGEVLLSIPLSAAYGHMSLPDVRDLYADSLHAAEDSGGGGCRLDAQSIALARWMLREMAHNAPRHRATWRVGAAVPPSGRLCRALCFVFCAHVCGYVGGGVSACLAGVSLRCVDVLGEQGKKGISLYNAIVPRGAGAAWGGVRRVTTLQPIALLGRLAGAQVQSPLAHSRLASRSRLQAARQRACRPVGSKA